MTAVEDRPLRADAARNVERILRAARDVYGELGSVRPSKPSPAVDESVNERSTAVSDHPT